MKIKVHIDGARISQVFDIELPAVPQKGDLVSFEICIENGDEPIFRIEEVCWEVGQEIPVSIYLDFPPDFLSLREQIIRKIIAKAQTKLT